MSLTKLMNTPNRCPHSVPSHHQTLSTHRSHLPHGGDAHHLYPIPNHTTPRHPTPHHPTGTSPPHTPTPIPHHTTPHHDIAPQHATPHHTTPRHRTTSRHTKPRHTTPHHTTPHHTIPPHRPNHSLPTGGCRCLPSAALLLELLSFALLALASPVTRANPSLAWRLLRPP